MNLFKLSPDTLYNLTCDVIDTLEYMIPESSFLSNNEVYAQLKETLGYSLVHIRNVFDFSIARHSQNTLQGENILTCC